MRQRTIPATPGYIFTDRSYLEMYERYVKRVTLMSRSRSVQWENCSIFFFSYVPINTTNTLDGRRLHNLNESEEKQMEIAIYAPTLRTSLHTRVESKSKVLTFCITRPQLRIFTEMLKYLEQKIKGMRFGNSSFNR
jgi:hypothetical protein